MAEIRIPRRRAARSRKRRRDSFLPPLLLLTDSAVIFYTLMSVFWFRFSTPYFMNKLGAIDQEVYVRAFTFVTVTLLFFLNSQGLYRSARTSFTAETFRIFKAVAYSMVLLTATTFFVRDFSFSRTYLVMAGLALACGLSAARFLFGLAVVWVDRRRGSLRKILIVGCDDNARRLARWYARHPRLGAEVVGFLDDAFAPAASIDGLPVEGRISELGAYLHEHPEIHEVIVAVQGLPAESVVHLLAECEKRLVLFRSVADVFGLIASKMSVAYVAGVPVLSFGDSPLANLSNRFLKRSTDLVLSTAALVVLWPVFLVLAILVKLDSRGPVFFRQKRIGEDGKLFQIYKFRTMKHGIERESGKVWAVENDPRRTRLGVTLRRTNLDELPQLINVLAGDMSLVGPRPERPVFVKQFREDIPRYMARHRIRSGLTGWAQVNGLRGNTSIEERTKYDLYYIENWSLKLDAKILGMTVWQIFRSPNAY